MKGRRALLWARRLTQLSFLGLFFYLFRLTDYKGKDQIAAAVNIFFRWNPLVALSVTLAAKALLALFLPALLLAVLTLLQGFGRLIRHRQDRGVLALLDPRVRTKGYGASFLEAFPPAPVTSRLDDIGRFFAR